MWNKYQIIEGGVHTNLRRVDLQETRQEEAVERQTARDARTNVQQIAVLDGRLGEGVGATKERARLAA
jgi:hypothetical protein